MFISISLLLIGACDTCFMEAVHNYLFDWVILAGYHTSSYKSLVMVFILGALPCVNKLLAPAISLYLYYHSSMTSAYCLC